MAYRYGKPLTLAMASPHCGRRQQLMAAENTPIKILSVDDHPLLREGIAALLEGQQDMVLVGESANGRDAIATFRAHRPDVTLMDLQMPEINGIEAIIAIRREFPGARIVVLTTYNGEVRAARPLSAAASGFLLKSAVRKDFLDTIRTVHGGRKQIPPEIAAEIAEHHCDDALTEREIEVLREVAAADANKIFAAELSLNGETAKTHIKKTPSKIGPTHRPHTLTTPLQPRILHF